VSGLISIGDVAGLVDKMTDGGADIFDERPMPEPLDNSVVVLGSVETGVLPCLVDRVEASVRWEGTATTKVRGNIPWQTLPLSSTYSPVYHSSSTSSVTVMIWPMEKDRSSSWPEL